MAVVVLVLWLFTAGAGFYLLLTSSLGRARPPSPSTPSPQPASLPQPASVPQSAPISQQAPVPHPTAAASASSAAPSNRAARRASRDRWDPPSLTAAKQAPMLPSARSLVEFGHPALGITGLAFWLGFTLVHTRILGWIAFGVIVATACVGLGWFTANTRAARRAATSRPDATSPPNVTSPPNGTGRLDTSAPSFAGRLVAVHGSAAALTLTLAALTVLVLHG